METLEFDLPSALLNQLVELLDNMHSESLVQENLENVPEEQGVYQLFHKDELVYIGKTDSEAGLKNRLSRHCKKIKNRQNLDSKEVTFKAVRIYVFTAMDLETQLRDHYKNLQVGLKWQNSGFGSNDPGRNRDEGKPGTFDQQFPIDINFTFDNSLEVGKRSVLEALEDFKSKVPYVVRFERERTKNTREPNSDLRGNYVTISESIDTPKKLLDKVATVLGDDWQITVLPGYVIIYKESKNYCYKQQNDEPRFEL